MYLIATPDQSKFFTCQHNGASCLPAWTADKETAYPYDKMEQAEEAAENRLEEFLQPTGYLILNINPLINKADGKFTNTRD